MCEATWRIYLFGSLTTQSGQTTLNHLSMRRAGALLACLTLRAPHPVPREEVLTLLWPDEAPDVARNRLRVLLNSLRRKLEFGDRAPGSVLNAERHALSIVPLAFTSDYHDFLRALQAARATTQETEQIASLENAVRLYRGELLAGYYDDWILAERSRIAAIYYQALRELAQRLMRIDAPERGLDYARQAVTEEPLDEEAHCDLIRFYRQMGQPSAGLRQYEQLKRLLWEEMQARPSETSRRLAAQLTADMGHGIVEVRRSIRPIALCIEEQTEEQTKEQTEEQALPDYLPPRLTRFFGRVEEIAHLHSLLAPDSDVRLVSLLGLGGTGKTRLAVEAAARLQNVYAGRVYFAAFVDITDLNHIGSALATALRLPAASGIDPLSQAITVLNQAPTLLVLDNLEQLLPDAGPLIEHLLLEAPQLRCLLTSRRNAGIAGEQEIALKPLPVPGSKENGGKENGERQEQNNFPAVSSLLACPGVALFVDRARAVRADFALTAKNANDVAQLCVALEGLPLAIELAAARTRVMTPGEMRKQTGKLLNWLVDVGGGKNARHKSVRATLEWSYRLLALEDRRFFSKLAVFAGGFDAIAAGYVGIGEHTDLRETIDRLERLRAASLLTVVHSEETTTRFDMPTTLREFGLERLVEMGAETETRGRHLAFFVTEFQEQSKPFKADGHDLTLTGTEERNLREALEFGLRAGTVPEEARLAGQLACSLTNYWEKRGRWREGRDYLQRAGEISEDMVGRETKIEALYGAGMLANLLGDHVEAQTLSEASLALAQAAGAGLSIADSLSNLGNIAFSLHDYARARSRFQEAIRLYQQAKADSGVAACLGGLGSVAFYLGDHKTAHERMQEALTIYRQKGDQHGVASLLRKIGNVWRNQGHAVEGRAQIAKALELFQQTGNRQGIAGCLYDLGLVALLQHHYGEAEARFTQGMELFQEAGNRRGIAACLLNLGGIAVEKGDAAGGFIHYSEAIEMCRKLGDRRNMAACLTALGNLALDRGEHAEALARYREALDIEQTIDSRGGIANCRFALGRLAMTQNDLVEAQRQLGHALEIYHDIGAQADIAILLEAYARLLLAQQQPVRAARLAGATAVLDRKFNRPCSDAEARRRNELADTLRDLVGEAAFARAWQQGEALSPTEAVHEALGVAATGLETSSGESFPRPIDPPSSPPIPS